MRVVPVKSELYKWLCRHEDHLVGFWIGLAVGIVLAAVLCWLKS